MTTALKFECPIKKKKQSLKQAWNETQFFFTYLFVYLWNLFLWPLYKRLTKKLIQERNSQSEQLNTFCNLQLSAMKRGINEHKDAFMRLWKVRFQDILIFFHDLLVITIDFYRILQYFQVISKYESTYPSLGTATLK